MLWLLSIINNKLLHKTAMNIQRQERRQNFHLFWKSRQEKDRNKNDASLIWWHHKLFQKSRKLKEDCTVNFCRNKKNFLFFFFFTFSNFYAPVSSRAGAYCFCPVCPSVQMSVCTTLTLAITFEDQKIESSNLVYELLGWKSFSMHRRHVHGAPAARD